MMCLVSFGPVSSSLASFLYPNVVEPIYKVKKCCLVSERHEEKKKHIPKAQMTHLALFGPILVITGIPNPPCAFKL